MPSRFVWPAAYMMANRIDGVLYLGSTNDLPRRAYEHREGALPGFSRRFGCRRLVWCESFELMTEARRRELAIKHWSRAWKVALIEQTNPEWDDLYPTLA